MKSAHELPIDHPEYRYPASRNPYWAKLRAPELARRAYSDHQTEENAGHWRQEFRAEPDRPLHVEIGCNAGHVVLEWAARQPDHLYVGIDWKFKMIHKAVEKSARRGIGNVRFFRSHAERLPYMFGEGEIDFLYLYFPDPWPKKAQWKNRFVTTQRLREIAKVVKPGGVFHIKTDHAGYFQWMEAAISQTENLWQAFDRTTDLHQGHPEPASLEIPEVTLFERLFIKDRIPIHSIKLRRRG